MPSESARDELYQLAARAARLGLLVNLALGVAKLAGGLLSGSFALVSDAVNSLGDAVTSMVVLFAFRVAQRPPDAEHPYGHSRAEAIAAANVALFIVLSALMIGWEAGRRSMAVHPTPPAWTLWLAAVNVAIKEGLYRYKMAVGLRTGSTLMMANAWDHRSDALCSLAVFVGLGLAIWGGPAFHLADEMAALVVAAAIVWSGVRLFRQSASELMDVQANEQFVEQVRRAARSVGGVQGVEKLWLRKSGLEYFADIHIQVSPQITVAAGHEIGHRVKDRLLDEFASLRDVLVHLEPYGGCSLEEPPQRLAHGPKDR
ncbi:MAG TPA: cation diffusion facilitator family transporter [Pirellulales bacterium]|nr:cation diffusion facilitator family transporter [Pirellulales bacterium]